MKEEDNSHYGRARLRRRLGALALFGVVVSGAAIYAFNAERNPPGFFVDESSIAFNAHNISQSGRDEFGNSWPLFFPAFGDYKNPVYIYLLAAIFKLTGPGILEARLLSAMLGVAAAAALGLLAARTERKLSAGALVALSALLTPWLFEISRVVLEVSLYPLALALLLLALQRASEREEWRLAEAASIALSLALLTYTYSVGRLHAPLLALGLIIFMKRARLKGLALAWVLYAASLLPLLLYHLRHPGALTERFKLVSYIKPESAFTEIAREFVLRYAASFDPRALFFHGDRNIYQVAHVLGEPLVLVATGLLAATGLVVVLARRRSDTFWRYVVLGLLVSPVPASLTLDFTHTLRLVPVAVFLVVLTAPAFGLLSARGAGTRPRTFALVAIVSLTLFEGALFQYRYHLSASSEWRRHLFDADFPDRIFARALADPRRPIYIAEVAPTHYIQTLWHGALRGVAPTEFVRLAPTEAPPPGSLVIMSVESCRRCEIIESVEPYTLYTAKPLASARAPLGEGGFQARLSAPQPPRRMRAGERATFDVRVENASEELWLGGDRGVTPFQVTLGNHWLDPSGRELTHDDGRAVLTDDLAPGASLVLKLTINAPSTPGDYILELDMLQEGVTWFGLKGSPTLRVPVVVE